jgi:hypothetical protein
MKAVWIRNGKTQLVLIPTDEIETAMLKELSKTPVDISQHLTLQTGLESVNDCIVITPQILVSTKTSE